MLLHFSVVFFFLATVASAKLPNIVVILADDMGYGDVGFLNPESTIPTPNLDALAKQGMAFLDAHTPSSVCTPTRYGLLTGRYSWRTRLKRGVLNGYGEPLLASDRETIGTFLGASGYQTAIVGKWHLGLGFAKSKSGEFDFNKPVSDGPHTHGFKESFIIPASLDFPPYVYIRNGEITAHPLVEQPALKFPRFMRKGERGPDLDPVEVLDDLVEQAADFIEKASNKSDPFLLYVPLTAPHKPVWPAERFQGKTNIGPYGDFIVHVDAAVGGVLSAIEKASITQDTLVLFTSDNGSYMYRLDGISDKDHTDDSSVQAYRSLNHTANYVYRGTKADIWEAGQRVPFVVRWPAQIKADSVQNTTVCLTDVFATLAEIAGRDLPMNVAEDSFSLLPLFRGGVWEKQRAPVIHHSSGGMFAIRDGRWKLIAGNGSGGREKPSGEPFGKPYQLFDLETDPSEKHNVYDSQPIVATRLEQELERIRSRGRSR